MNYGIQIPNFIALIQQWRRRFHKHVGRVTVTKTLLIPKLNHLISMYSNTKSQKGVISLLCRAMFEFLWNSKVDKVRRNVITHDYLSRGLKLVNMIFFIYHLNALIKSLTSCTCYLSKPWMGMFFAVNEKMIKIMILETCLRYNIC